MNKKPTRPKKNGSSFRHQRHQLEAIDYHSDQAFQQFFRLNRCQRIDYLHQYRTQMPHWFHWRVIDSITNTELIAAANQLWRFRSWVVMPRYTGIDDATILKMDGIWRYYRLHRSLTQAQHRWIAMSLLDYWQLIPVQ
jgi:hypothetical protein